MNGAEGRERRRFERIERSLVTYYRKLDEPPAPEPWDKAALARNVSLGGVLVELDENLHVGDRLSIEIHLGAEQPPVTMTGRIVRKISNTVGIQFEEMNDGDAGLFRLFLERRSRGGDH